MVANGTNDAASAGTEGHTLWVAIVGAGPAGYYTAEALTKGDTNVRVDIIDRLPTPFGLIRAGVAPDHQSIKNVSRRYSATNDRDNVRFVGNLALGSDISMAELKELYDVVILATGAARDRTLGIKGETLTGVYGSGAFVGWYNSHPDYTDLNPDLRIASVAVIGNGNVAVDVARILAKTASEMDDTDLAGHAAKEIHASLIRDIYILGRRGPLEAAFTPKELSELNRLENCVALVDETQLPDTSIDQTLTGAAKKNMVSLRAMVNNQPGDKPVRLHIKFYVRPTEIVGDGTVCCLKLEETRVEDGKCIGTGVFETLPAGLVVHCIGYRSSPIENVPYDEKRGVFISDEGRIDDQLYCVGWARRGPTGTIGTNKPDGIEIAVKILAAVMPSGKTGRAGLERIAQDRGLHIVTFADWKKIDAAEVAAAQGGAPRSKFSAVEDMVTIAENQKSDLNP